MLITLIVKIVRTIAMNVMMEILAQIVPLGSIYIMENVIILVLPLPMKMTLSVHLVHQIVIIVAVMEVIVHNVVLVIICMGQPVLMTAHQELFLLIPSVKTVRMIVMNVVMQILVKSALLLFICIKMDVLMIVHSEHLLTQMIKFVQTVRMIARHVMMKIHAHCATQASIYTKMNVMILVQLLLMKMALSVRFVQITVMNVQMEIHVQIAVLGIFWMEQLNV